MSKDASSSSSGSEKQDSHKGTIELSLVDEGVDEDFDDE